MTRRHPEDVPREPIPARRSSRRQRQLLEAERTLRAIQEGDVDQVVVKGPRGPTVVSLQSALERELQRDLLETQALAKVGTWSFRNGLFTWSDQMYTLHGRDPLLGPPLLEETFALFDATSATRFTAAVQSAVQTGQGFDLDLELAGAQPRWCRMHAEATRSPAGNITGLRGTAQDMTVPRKAEAERERLRFLDIEVGRLKGLNDMRNDFLNAAAHDLNNPLTPILVQLAVMAQEAGADEHRQAGIKLLHRNLKRLQVIIQDMLVSGRLQSGRLKLKCAPREARALLQQAVESFQAIASAGGVHIRLAADPLMVEMDEERMGQVVYNLLSNGVKYTPAGGTVDVRLSSTAGKVLISVADSGLGMTSTQLERLFQPFVRLHENMPDAAKGTGLGLYICKGLVEAHGGRIWATSAGPGLGSTFSVELPLRQPE